MSPLPRWMRIALAARAVMNLVGALSFTPLGAPLRALAGLPETAGTGDLFFGALFVRWLLGR